MGTRKTAWYKEFRRDPRGLQMAHGVKGVLANVFRTMMWDLNVYGPRYNSFMEFFLGRTVRRLERKRREKEARNTDPNKKPINHQEQNRIDRTSARGNINKELSQSTMTWNVFAKGLDFLQIDEFRLIILAKHKNGVVTQHNSPVVKLSADDPLDLPGMLDEQAEPQYRTRVESVTNLEQDIEQLDLPGFGDE